VCARISVRAKFLCKGRLNVNTARLRQSHERVKLQCLQSCCDASMTTMEIVNVFCRTHYFPAIVAVYYWQHFYCIRLNSLTTECLKILVVVLVSLYSARRQVYNSLIGTNKIRSFLYHVLSYTQIYDPDLVDPFVYS